jgi:hypothetical protein
MNSDVKSALEKIVKSGIRVTVDPSGTLADEYILTMPNGDQYQCLAAGLVKLAREIPTEDEVKAAGTRI